MATSHVPASLTPAVLKGPGPSCPGSVETNTQAGRSLLSPLFSFPPPPFLSLCFKLVINLYTINFGISATSRCTGQGHDAHSRPVAFRPLSPGLSIFPPDTLTA